MKNYIDLFAGCGGLSLGLHNSGWRGLFAIEKGFDAFSTLKFNLIDGFQHFDWPKWLPMMNHDIVDIISAYKKELRQLRGSVDMVVGGPPCQGFSMAGRRKEGDTRNLLVNAYIDFIKLVQPKIIFFENVKGFTLEFKKNKNKGIKYSSYVIDNLKKNGYRVHGELINFGDFGIPQKRIRFILFGVRKDAFSVESEIAKTFFDLLKNNRMDFLKSKSIPQSTTVEDAISDLLKSNGVVPSPDSKNFENGVYSNAIFSEYQRFLRLGCKSNIPDSHRFARHRPDIQDKFKYILKKSRRNKDLDKSIRKLYNIKKHTLIPLAPNEKSPTITTLPDDYIHYKEPRILTVREYARIQSFPDYYQFKGKYTSGGQRRIHETPRYTQIGNAIPPLVGEQIGNTIRLLFT